MTINVHSVDCQVEAALRSEGLSPCFPEKAAMHQVERPRGQGRAHAAGESGEASVEVESLGSEVRQSSA